MLRRHCDEVGRPYDEIERTTLSSVHLAAGAESAADAIAKLAQLADVGVQQAIVNLPNLYEADPLEIFAREIIPALDER